MFDFTVSIGNMKLQFSKRANSCESKDSIEGKKKISFIVKKINKIKRWYQNRMNPNQWIIDFLKQKKQEYIRSCHIKYNYHLTDNYNEMIRQLIYDINHQTECIQFVRMISKMPKRFSVSSAPASPSYSSEYDSIIHTDSDLPSQKLSGVEIDLEIMILEYMVLKEHLGKIMKYLQDNRISITTSIEIPGTPRSSALPEYILSTSNT